VSLPIVVVLMLLVASAVAMATRKLRIPYTVALVITGVVLSIINTLYFPDVDTPLHLTEDLLFAVLLPILIYEAAFHLELREFLSSWKSILTLAVLGVLVGIFSCGGLIYGGLQLTGVELSFGGAVLIATVLAATDPVGVISLLRATRAPRRLAVLMEGESLLNDGVAVVAFAVVLVALGLDQTQGQITAPWLLRFVAWELLGAVLLGGGLGFFMAWLTSKVDDHLIEITLTTIGAFGSFLVAQKVHSSGVIACLVAGMLAGNFGAKYGMSASTRVAVISFWDYAVFVANSIVFLLIGLDVNPVHLLRDWAAILIVWVAMMISRAFFVYLTLPQISRLEGGIPKGFGTVVVWGGIRGGIAMVLALGIPRSFEYRELAVNCIFGASLLTILVQSTTMGPLLRKLGLAADRSAFEIVETLRGQLRALQSGMSYLERQRELGIIPEGVYGSLNDELKQEADELLSRRDLAEEMEEQVRKEEVHALRRKLLLVRKESLRQASVDGAIDELVMRKLVGQLDERLHTLDEAHHEEVEAFEEEMEDEMEELEEAARLAERAREAEQEGEGGGGDEEDRRA
jgi:CPA1 family monovalent cation:H+ antiporter